jgi:hypothetical protein
MKTLSLYLSTAADVNEVAETIAKCDFRTAMSRYTTGNDSPWVITVGESGWHRHLVVLETFDGDAKLGLLTKEQSERRITDIDTSAIERTMTLGELTAFSYSGIRKLLTAELAAA